MSKVQRHAYIIMHDHASIWISVLENCPVLQEHHTRSVSSFLFPQINSAEVFPLPPQPPSWIVSIINVWTWSLRSCHPLLMPDDFSLSLPGPRSFFASSLSVSLYFYPSVPTSIRSAVWRKANNRCVFLPQHDVSSSSSTCHPIFNLLMISSG